jgi:peptide-methionine (S)-S-oxide reductase
LRYCINSAALDFNKAAEKADNEEKISDSGDKAVTPLQATFGAGCFWGVEVAFARVDGVLTTAVGYMGGHTVDPTYGQVCSGNTGHAEVVHVTYDPARVSYEELLDVFFANHNPTTPNRQGPDVGTQYRSAIFYHTESQREAAKDKVASLEKKKRFSGSIVTEITAASPFYRAEEYHQRYLEKRGVASCGRE